MVDISAARTAVREEMLRLAVRCRKVHSAVVQVVLVLLVELVELELPVAVPVVVASPKGSMMPSRKKTKY